jgi:hypothetical protein
MQPGMVDFNVTFGDKQRSALDGRFSWQLDFDLDQWIA